MNVLIMADIQYDFLPGGALPVLRGDIVIPVANRLMPYFDLVIATQDWHPQNHVSFASNNPGHKPGDVIDVDGIQQILWPDHCVPGTHGAELSVDLRRDEIDHYVHKGTNPRIDSYSTFFDNAHLQSTGLCDYLKERGVNDVYLMGLATDYCVKYSVLDACKLGFTTFVVTDGCRGINLNPGDIDHAFVEMQTAGATLLNSEDVIRKLSDKGKGLAA